MLIEHVKRKMETVIERYEHTAIGYLERETQELNC